MSWCERWKSASHLCLSDTKSWEWSPTHHFNVHEARKAKSHTVRVGDLVPAPFLSSTREGSDRIRTPRSRSQLDSVWTTTSHGTLAVIIV